MFKLWIGITIIISVAATGCQMSRQFTERIPQYEGRLRLKVSHEKPSALGMRMGVYRIPDTSVYISGHQKAEVLALLLGLPGVAVGHFAMQSVGENKAGDPTPLRIEIVEDTERLIKEELERRRDLLLFSPPGIQANATLEVVPYVVLTFVGDELVRPWVLLSTSLKSDSDEEKWTTRYSASLDASRPLAGDNGWTSTGGEPLRKAVDRALRAAITVMISDAAGELPRRTGQPDAIDGFVYAAITIVDRQGFLISPVEVRDGRVGTE